MGIAETSSITCPACGHRAEETMPRDACVYFWACPHCGVVARPKAGDCCVFCSYGTVPCPPKHHQETPGC
ncbi:MAG: GDCCVxC domain-containing (seleno)protein [Gemmatimonadales bacterium]